MGDIAGPGSDAFGEEGLSEHAPGATPYYLWGIDGDLRGNEVRMQGCLPFFRHRGDEAIFAARRASWNFETKEDLSVLPSAEEARGLGTQIESKRRIAVSPGQLVVVFGPEFYAGLRQTDPELIGRLGELELIQMEFRVGCLQVEQFEKLAQLVSLRAKDIFDREISRFLGSKVSDRAASALTVLRNTGYALPHDQTIRTLVAERLRRNPDRYRKSLKLGALRLQKPPEELEAEVRQYLDILLSQVAAREPRTGLRIRQPLPTQPTRIGTPFTNLLPGQEPSSQEVQIVKRYRRSRNRNENRKSPKTYSLAFNN